MRFHLTSVGLATAAALCAQLAGAAPPANPDDDRIRAAMAIVQDCAQSTGDDLHLLSDSDRALLDDLALTARHTDLTRAYESQDLHAWIRPLRAGRAAIDAVSAYHALCADGQFDAIRIMLEATRPGMPQVRGNLAWVPLLTHEGHFTTLGLAFSRNALDGRWGLQLRAAQKQDWVAPAPALRALRLRMASAGPGDAEGFTEPLPHCQARPAPEPQDGTQVLDRFSSRWFQQEELLPGPVNAISPLQRQAVAYYAEGRERPADARAQAIQAEALYRSAFFRRGPVPDSPAWWAQLERAVTFAERARMAGAPVERLAGLVGHYALIVETGTPRRPGDLAKAAALLKQAAQMGDYDAAVRLAQYQWEGLGPMAPDCLAAARSLEPLAPGGLLERAQLAVDCPDLSQRRVEQLDGLLAQIEAAEEAETWWHDEEQLDALQLAARCQKDPLGLGCAGRPPLIYSGQLLARVRAEEAETRAQQVGEAPAPTDPADPDYDASQLSPLRWELRSPPRVPFPEDLPESRKRGSGC